MVRAGGCALDAYTWQRAIGERIASRSCPENLRDGVLTLTVVSSVWAQELSLLSGTIIERLASAGFAVRIRCRVVAPRARERQNSRQPAMAPTPTTVPKVELPAELTSKLAQIADEDLRDIIEAAARSQMQSQMQKRAALMTGKQSKSTRSNGPTEATPAVRGPQSSARESAQRGQNAAGPNAVRQRTRGPR